MKDRTLTYVGLGVAVVLIVAGTLATGLLPPSGTSQILAGGLIVAGFAVAYAAVGASDFLE